MNWLKLALPATVLMGGFFVCTTSVYGTADYAKPARERGFRSGGPPLERAAG